MKKIMLFLVLLSAVSLRTTAMTYEQARSEAMFLTDKMAYELKLSNAQYEAAYEINLDYLMSVFNGRDVLGTCWEHRNIDLRYVLHAWQWEAFCAANYFYRPLYWNAGRWHFYIYARYPHRDYLYYGRPHFYATYRGGHSWRNNGGRSYYRRDNHHSSYRDNHYSSHRDNHHANGHTDHQQRNRDTSHGREYHQKLDHGQHKNMTGHRSSSRGERSAGRQR